ncbi:hypothetical protein MIC97_01805 [Aquamicrobium sp. NLF2-7]|jgi:hypothetical protein|uniref:Uncharacterized protein n=2 Tax=Aquamicrobium TaxID=69278 RepID=A0A7W9VVZ9_9HYPH|nr:MULTISPECIES: hypothetical protein [Aquamicrobium]MBB6012780.1 hypothetical protein [Aquamicrobium lusatiense]MCG8270247.1 hypothetical protein [Aquamicrobium sp. NLF2-7]MDH4993278.1 hypothetical protein [Aquamicrobium lusatiense]
MRARTATIGDLETVFRDLSGRMSADYVAAGLTVEGAQDSLTMDLKEGRAHALLDDDTVVAIITWHEIDHVAETAFAAREGFFTASTVRFCKKHIRRIQELTGNMPIRSRSWLGEPEVTRWFRIIGYEQLQGNGSRLFELPPA